VTSPQSAVPKLTFRGGTLELYDYPRDAPEVETPPAFSFDARVGALRAPAHAYAALILWLRERGIAVQDEARRYDVLPLTASLAPARPYQVEALAAWSEAGARGVIVLPTGAGKTHVAIAAIAQRKRSTLVVAPTLELVRQWAERLHEAFGVPIGVVGGGSHDVQPLTITTYDSAHLHMAHLGARFGCLVFDECHHLPTESYAFASRGSLAPFRLGLTATPERADGGEDQYLGLIGPIVYRKDIVELTGTFLSSYETVRVPVALDDSERAAHDAARTEFRTFVAKHRIPLGAPQGFQTFLRKASLSHEGRSAMAAYRAQRRLALFGAGKLRALAELFETHKNDRILVFTDDNQAAHRISCEFLVPVLTHRTKVKERLALMSDFRSGVLPILVTSKVLNEGVDVPEANVAIVVSGSGSVREHVQRLGRVLRAREGKSAVLYELVTADSSDEGRSARRREHSAYR